MSGGWDLSGSLVVKTPRFPDKGHKLDPRVGNEDPTCHTMQPKGRKYVCESVCVYIHMCVCVCVCVCVCKKNK